MQFARSRVSFGVGGDPPSTTANVLPAWPITLVLAAKSAWSAGQSDAGIGSPNARATLALRTHLLRYQSALPSRRYRPLSPDGICPVT